MKEKEGPIVYKGMTAEQLGDAYNVFLTIPDPMGWLQANRVRAQLVEAELKPIKDLAYGEEPIQKLDIYAPKDAKNAPVLIDIHGGGWTAGSKNPRALQAQSVNAIGAIWVPIDYGLAPEYSMDQMIDHVRRAISWIYRNIAQYGGDPDQLFVFGNSAGAHLAGTALMPAWPHKYGIPENVIKGAVLTSGVFDLEVVLHALPGPQEALKMTLAYALHASPILHLPEHLIPIIVAYGQDELEGFILESKNYALALKKAGFDVTLIEVPAAHHFDMINELANTHGQLFKAVKKMLIGRMH